MYAYTVLARRVLYIMESKYTTYYIVLVAGGCTVVYIDFLFSRFPWGEW